MVEGLPAAGGASSVPQCEKDFMAALQQQGIDTAVACQVNLRYWSGRIDFYHIPTRTAMQVDGSSHFAPAFYSDPCNQLMLDLRCCRAAWFTRNRLLRVHYTHAQYATAAVEAISLVYGSFVMVSAEYKDVQVTIGGITKSYVDWLKCMLWGSKWYLHSAANCMVFY
jgi:hypothetical protein